MWLYVVCVCVSGVPDRQVCDYVVYVYVCPVYLIGRYVAVCCLCVCVSGVPDRQVHRTHIHIDSIQPHTKQMKQEG